MLTTVVWFCLIGAALLLGYSAYAAHSEFDAQKSALRTLDAVAKEHRSEPGAGGAFEQQGAEALVEKPIEALAKLAEALGKLRTSVAALVLAFGLIMLAGVFASVLDKIPTAN
ncbi:hypothetical protein ACFRAQ_07295 [Nocardia sp. NPDC056611]|uniref:hypothetical protein n=1 Tax=unclassified Nocardia TaxID=2637762 RepID=UPI00366A64F6